MNIVYYAIKSNDRVLFLFGLWNLFELNFRLQDLVSLFFLNNPTTPLQQPSDVIIIFRNSIILQPNIKVRQHKNVNEKPDANAHAINVIEPLFNSDATHYKKLETCYRNPC